MSDIGGLRLVEEEPEMGTRTEVRVLLAAILVTTTREQPVKLRALSAAGATIEGMNLPGQGKDVILKRGTLEIFATVAWAEGRRCTLDFETPITDEEVWAQIRHPRPGPAPVEAADPRRPGFHGVAVNAADRQAAAEWAQPAGRLAWRD